MRVTRVWGKPKRGTGPRIAARVVTALSVLLIALVALDLRVRPMVEDVLSYQAQNSATRMMNAAMLEELSRDGPSCDELVRLTRARDGSVASIETDIVAVNRLKARMAQAVYQSLDQQRGGVIRIPAGTLLGNHLTSGRGPEVEIRVIALDYVESELYSVFEAAGINQTRHQIMLDTRVQIAAVLPGYTVRTTASTSFCVAETVIVGQVPEGYTIVGEGAANGVVIGN